MSLAKPQTLHTRASCDEALNCFNNQIERNVRKLFQAALVSTKAGSGQENLLETAGEGHQAVAASCPRATILFVDHLDSKRMYHIASGALQEFWAIALRTFGVQARVPKGLYGSVRKAPDRGCSRRGRFPRPLQLLCVRHLLRIVGASGYRTILQAHS